MGLNALQEWGSDKWPLKLNTSNWTTVSHGRSLDSKYKYYMASTEFKKFYKMNDLRVLLNTELSFVSYCK